MHSPLRADEITILNGPSMDSNMFVHFNSCLKFTCTIERTVSNVAQDFIRSFEAISHNMTLALQYIYWTAYNTSYISPFSISYSKLSQRRVDHVANSFRSLRT